MKKLLTGLGFLVALTFSTVNAGGLGILTSAIGKSAKDESVPGYFYNAFNMPGNYPVKIYLNAKYMGEVANEQERVSWSIQKLRSTCNSSLCTLTVTAFSPSEHKQTLMISSQFSTFGGQLYQDVTYLREGYGIGHSNQRYTIMQLR